MQQATEPSLVECLEAAISEPDLVADIIEACRLSNTSAADLAGWSLEDIASKLFLTEAEAAKLSDVCKKVTEGDMSALEASKQRNEEQARATAEGGAQAYTPEQYSTPVAGGRYEDDQEEGEEEGQQQQGHGEERTPEPEDHHLQYGEEGENHRFSNGDEQVTPAAETEREHQEHEEQQEQGEEHEEQQEGDKKDAQGTATEDNHQHEQEDGGDSGAAAAMAAAAAAVPVPAETPPRSASLDKQGSAGSGGKAQLPAMELSDSLPSFKENTSPEAKIPSYLRATTSYKAHTGKLGPEKSPSPDQSLSKSTSSARKVNTASSRLLAPTASYLTHIKESRKESKAEREKAEAAEREKKERELKKVFQSPQGQRVTKAQPFHFKAEERPKTANTLTSEERAFLEAQKNAWKRHEVPKHIKEHRPIEGVRVHSQPKSPQDFFKPFQLASLEKHEK
ncbi:hypothetical protein DUNSADRAFT_12964 [Dunaliella salina]|uniref:Uncharacterized protein n=1 Tax=Dunaliella salina TaxID=3046 RepID=A0ABQ7GAC0_DUNSA|nr:hypothetical protein DUNSADRAFT_12964 [Dunaliella salina]|eukprot:KAF5831551.1 hypothetical protein DUNSADRAFT_12964 [Dunaliella salina]